MAADLAKEWHPASSLGATYRVPEGLACEDSTRGVEPVAMGRMWPRMAMNVAQHKNVNLLKVL